MGRPVFTACAAASLVALLALYFAFAWAVREGTGWVPTGAVAWGLSSDAVMAEWTAPRPRNVGPPPFVQSHTPLPTTTLPTSMPAAALVSPDPFGITPEESAHWREVRRWEASLEPSIRHGAIGFEFRGHPAHEFPSSLSATNGYVYSIRVALWALMAGALLLPARWAWWFRGHRRRQDRLARGICPTCGYDIRATPDRCPECGTMFAAPRAETPAPPDSPQRSRV